MLEDEREAKLEAFNAKRQQKESISAKDKAAKMKAYAEKQR